MLKRSFFLFSYFMMSFYFVSCQMPSSLSKNRTLHLNFGAGDPPSLHPHQLQKDAHGRALSKLLFEGLTRINSKGDSELTGASSVQISPNGLHYKFSLREQKWSDGMDVTAYHYEQAWKGALSPTSDCSWAYLLYIIKGAQKVKCGELSMEEVGIKALDAKTLDIQLASPTAYFLELLGQPIFMPTKGLEEPSCFNGPFVVDNWEKERCLHLKANRNFWNHKSTSLKLIDVFMVKDARTAFFMYEKGDIDWIGRPLSNPTSEDLEHLIQKKQAQYYHPNRPFWIYFNTEKSPFTSMAIRQALSIAFDRSCVESIFVGDTSLYTPLSKGLSLSRQSFDFDIPRAKQLFQKGLEELKLDRSSFPPIVLSYYNVSSHKRLMEFLKESWEKTLGITVQLVGLDWNSLCDALEKGTFHIGGCTESSLISDPIELLEKFEYKDMCNNFSKWDSPPYREKISKIRELFQSEERNLLIRDAEEILFEEAPLFPVANSNHVFSVPSNLKGFVFDHSGCVDMAYVYFK